MINRIAWGMSVLGLALPCLAAPSERRAITFEERVAAQRAIEQVYWSHRIWPQNNPGSKPPFSAVLSETDLRAKVATYLQESDALDRIWRRPISAADLQSELDRMASSTRAPDMLHELFAALGNDAPVIAETLARQSLADRLVRGLYAHDERFHDDVQRRAELALASCSNVACMSTMGGRYAETTWQRSARNLGGSSDALQRRTLGRLEETEEGFSVSAVLSESAGAMTVASVVWQKQPFDAWWRSARRELGTGIEVPRGEHAITTPAAGGCTVDTWSGIPTSGQPSAREGQTTVWTGTEMIVWGGYDDHPSPLRSGGRLNLATGSWLPTPDGGGSPAARYYHTAVWTGTEMIVWGGTDGRSNGYMDSGGRYDPANDSWHATARNGDAPGPRVDHVAIWTGTEMIIWGGGGGNGVVNTGARYAPASDSWTAMTTAGAPSPRSLPTAVWTGSEMIVWGGAGPPTGALNSGGRYSPSSDTWRPTSQGSGVPDRRTRHTAVWTGNEMIVWGGYVNNGLGSNTGGRYDPAGDSWAATSLVYSPDARSEHSAVWTGTEMIVWGGSNSVPPPGLFNSGGRYNPSNNSGLAMSTGANVPSQRVYFSTGWTGAEMIIWGGYGGDGGNNQVTDTGGRYCASSCVLGAVEVCNGIDDDCDTAIDEDIPAPSGVPSLSEYASQGIAVLSWSPVSGATSYDVVVGDLALLHASMGDFGASTTGCLGNDLTGFTADETVPLPGGGTWHLVRAVNACSGNGSYDDGTQQGSRDVEIATSAQACPSVSSSHAGSNVGSRPVIPSSMP